MTTISQLFIHPIKSTRGIAVDSCDIRDYGCFLDRRWAIVNENNVVITGRKYPKLLAIESYVTTTEIRLNAPNQWPLSLPFSAHTSELLTVGFFSRTRDGFVVNKSINDWFSAYLGINCRLIYLGETTQNEVKNKHGGQPGDLINFSDQCPLLLLSEATLADLNNRLETPVSMRHFRPNIVIKGNRANAEDTWKKIRIGEAEFDVAQRCIRCIFTTIDPTNLQKNKQGEPLRTLATYRKDERGGVAFGMHLIPRKTGQIRVGDEVAILA